MGICGVCCLQRLERFMIIREIPAQRQMEGIDLPGRGQRRRLSQSMAEVVVAADLVKQHLPASAEASCSCTRLRSGCGRSLRSSPRRPCWQVNPRPVLVRALSSDSDQLVAECDRCNSSMASCSPTRPGSQRPSGTVDRLIMETHDFAAHQPSQDGCDVVVEVQVGRCRTRPSSTQGHQAPLN
jgi:hypothetical protein